MGRVWRDDRRARCEGDAPSGSLGLLGGLLCGLSVCSVDWWLFCRLGSSLIQHLGTLAHRLGFIVHKALEVQSEYGAYCV